MLYDMSSKNGLTMSAFLKRVITSLYLPEPTALAGINGGFQVDRVHVTPVEGAMGSTDFNVQKGVK